MMSRELKTNVFICVSEIFTFEHCHPTGYWNIIYQLLYVEQLLLFFLNALKNDTLAMTHLPGLVFKICVFLK